MQENDNGLPIIMATSDQQTTNEMEIFPEFVEGTFMSRSYNDLTLEKALEEFKKRRKQMQGRKKISVKTLTSFC